MHSHTHYYLLHLLNGSVVHLPALDNQDPANAVQVSGCIISKKVKWGNASEVWANASEVWANASKIPDQQKKSHKVDLKIL